MKIVLRADKKDINKDEYKKAVRIAKRLFKETEKKFPGHRIPPVYFRGRCKASDGGRTYYSKTTKVPTYVTVQATWDNDVVYTLLHEWAHVFSLYKHKYAGHGKKFQTLLNRLLKKYYK